MANVDPWEPTPQLRYVCRLTEVPYKERRVEQQFLQQYWQRRVIEYRDYGGRPRRVESMEFEWRDVPTERE